MSGNWFPSSHFKSQEMSAKMQDTHQKPPKGALFPGFLNKSCKFEGREGDPKTFTFFNFLNSMQPYGLCRSISVWALG